MALNLPRKKNIYDTIQVVAPSNQNAKVTVVGPKQPKANTVKPQNNPLGYFGDFAGGVGNTLKGMAQAVPRGIKSLGMQLDNEQEFRPTGVLERAIYGNDPVRKAGDYARQTVNEAQTIASAKVDVGKNKVTTTPGTVGSGLPDIAAIPLGIALAASDITPLGGARKKATKDIAKSVAGDASQQGAKDVVSKAKPTVKPFTAEERKKLIAERQLHGDNFIPEPKTTRLAEFKPKAAAANPVKPAVTKPSVKPKTTRSNPADSLTVRVPQNIVDGESQAVRQLNLEKTQLKNRPPVTRRQAPTLRQQGDHLPVDQQLQAVQDVERAKYEQSGLTKLKNKVVRNLYDPRNVEQRLDNQEFKRLRKAGVTLRGQKDLLPEQSLTVQRGRINNPYQPAEVRLTSKFATDDGEFSVNDIIKIYGKENKPKARAFESYRIFKDELERIGKGQSPTTALSTDDMARYVAQYERSNPQAISHNRALREKELSEVAEKEAAGVIPQGTLETLAQYQFYAPRTRTVSDDLQKPQVSGGIRSGQKGIKQREQFNEAPTSPLSLYRENSIAHEKDLANQRYGTELRRRTQEGNVKGATEVVNAETVVEHKRLLRESRELAELLTQAKRDRNATRKVTTKTGQASRTAKVTGQKYEEQAISKVRELLASRANEGFGRNLTKSQLYAIAEQLADPTVSRTVSRAGVRTKLSKDLQAQVDVLKGELQSARDNVSQLEGLAKETNQAFRDTTQNNPMNTQAIQYRVNGEVGRIDVPGEYAESLSKQNEIAAQSVIDKVARPLSNAQKLVWTGILQPAFKVYNTLIKNPNLMFFNAEGASGIRPEVALSFARQIVNTDKMAQFKREMRSRGMAYENAFQSRNINKQVADDIAGRANVVTFFARNPVRTVADVWKGLNTAVASLDNAQRYAVSYGAYKRALDLGFPENQALDIAAQASAKVFGDFDRVSKLAQGLEAIIPYAGATQAGTRAIYRTIKTRPAEAALKATIMASAGAALAAYSIDNANEYYQDMIDGGKEYELDNNLTLALPGAAKDPLTGEWSGIIKIPLTPDFRPGNRAIWRSVYDVTHDSELDPTMVASELFNQFTGDMANQLYDPKRARGGNPATGILPSAPLSTLTKTGFNVNTYDGSALADGYTSTRPRTEQANDNTSEGARNISKLTAGIVTPLQADQIFSNMGATGDIIQDPSEAAPSLGASFVKPFTPGKSQKESTKSATAYFKDVDEVSRSIQDEKTFQQFKANHAKGTEEAKADLLANAKKLSQYFSISDGKFKTTDLFRAEKYLDGLGRKRGETGNPLFDLPDDQLQKVLEYRSSKMLNQGKQSYDKDGNSLFTSLGLDEPWYDEFTDKETGFWDSVKTSLQEKVANSTGKAKEQAQKSLDNLTNDDPATFSGKAKPKLTDEQDKSLDYYYRLPKGTGARSAYLKANPWILAYWEASDGFNSTERDVLALKNPATDDDSSGFGNSFGSSGGKKYDSSIDSRKYAISLNAGGEVAKPTVKAKGGKAKRKITPRQNVVKPKVSMQKKLT